MYINITDSETGNNKESSKQLVHYLEKENRLIDRLEPERWFNGASSGILPHEVGSRLDDNIAKLGRDDAKFFLINISPSQKEIAWLKSQYGEAGAKDMLKAFAVGIMDEYAKNFNRPGIKSNSDLLWERIFRADNRNEMLLIKLHGDYKYGDLKNSEEELSQQDPTFRSRLIDFVSDKHFIVSGYSGRDASVMEALKEGYSRRGSGRLYWCGYGRNIPPNVKDLLDTAKANGRTAFFIPTDGFDKLMISISKVCGNKQPDLIKKYAPFLQQEKAIDRIPFTMDVTRTTTIVKSNLFPLKLPQEIFQFEVSYSEGEKPWQTIRDLSKNEFIAAVPYKSFVWALGTMADINKCFQDRLIGKVSRVPFDSNDIIRVSAFHDLMLSALTKLLSSRHKLESNGKDLLWHSRTETARMLNSVLYQTHKGLRLSIATDNNKLYLSLMPDFNVTSTTPDATITKEIKQEVGRLYFDKIRNKAFNDYINDWRGIFLNTKAKAVELEFPLNSGTGLTYMIGKNPAFAKIMDALDKTGGIDVEKTGIPKFLFRYQGMQYPEPELIFSNRHIGNHSIPKDFHPMRGVLKNRPYDYPLTNVLFDGTIRLAVICPNQEGNVFNKFLKLHNVKVNGNKVNEDYLIDFPGFFEAFSASLNIPEIGSENWGVCPEPTVSENLKDIALDPSPKYTLICLCGMSVF
jgi:hypothetical protein